MKGYVHSQASFGTVDGPGIRYVVFVQGCPMRCQYCHNPDTWTPAIGQMMDTDEILAAYERNRVYYQNGGLTVTGGEPLLQIEFVTELFEKAKAKDIHTCLDTSGITFQPDNPTRMEAFDRLMQSTDLVMLDIKHIDPEKHRILTGQPNDGILAFARYLSDQKIPIWDSAMWSFPASPTTQSPCTVWDISSAVFEPCGHWMCCPITPWALPSTSSWALIIRCRVSRPWTKPGFQSCGPKSSGE